MQNREEEKVKEEELAEEEEARKKAAKRREVRSQSAPWMLQSDMHARCSVQSEWRIWRQDCTRMAWHGDVHTHGMLSRAAVPCRR